MDGFHTVTVDSSCFASLSSHCGSCLFHDFHHIGIIELSCLRATTPLARPSWSPMIVSSRPRIVLGEACEAFKDFLTDRWSWWSGSCGFETRPDEKHPSRLRNLLASIPSPSLITSNLRCTPLQLTTGQLEKAGCPLLPISHPYY